MLFTVIICLFVISVVFYVDFMYSSIIKGMEAAFGFNTIGRESLMDGLTRA